MSGYQVNHIDADVNNYKTYFCFDKIDIEVITEFITPNSYHIIVRRLDAEQGWNDNIEVLVYYRENQSSSLINIGTCDSREKIVLVEVDFLIEASTKPVIRSPGYSLRHLPGIYRISREEFNRDFSADLIVFISSSLN